jgi:hypothetical protein
MSGRIAKSQIPEMAHSALPVDVRTALIETKNQLKAGILPEVFGNNYGIAPGDGPPLPQLDHGCDYYEVDVGADRQEGRGCRRLVFEINRSSFHIANTYFTDDHYRKGTFFRVVKNW